MNLHVQDHTTEFNSLLDLLVCFILLVQLELKDTIWWQHIHLQSVLLDHKMYDSVSDSNKEAPNHDIATTMFDCW